MEQEWHVYVDARSVSWRRPEDMAGNVKAYRVDEGETGQTNIYERAARLCAHSYPLGSRPCCTSAAYLRRRQFLAS